MLKLVPWSSTLKTSSGRGFANLCNVNDWGYHVLTPKKHMGLDPKKYRGLPLSLGHAIALWGGDEFTFRGDDDVWVFMRLAAETWWMISYSNPEKDRKAKSCSNSNSAELPFYLFWGITTMCLSFPRICVLTLAMLGWDFFGEPPATCLVVMIERWWTLIIRGEHPRKAMLRAETWGTLQWSTDSSGVKHQTKRN